MDGDDDVRTVVEVISELILDGPGRDQWRTEAILDAVVPGTEIDFVHDVARDWVARFRADSEQRQRI